jgi:ketol-acid reductoisomerase
MRYSISDTAEYGDYSRGKRIVNERTRKEMQKILKEITSGRFAREWIKENAEGAPNFNASRKEQHDLQIEQVGAKLREMMPWTQRK